MPEAGFGNSISLAARKVEVAWREQPSDARELVRDGLNLRHEDIAAGAEVPEILIDRASIARRIDGLTASELSLLSLIASDLQAVPFRMMEDEAPSALSLREQGLVFLFPMTGFIEEDQLYVPLEVRLAMHEHGCLDDADLTVVLVAAGAERRNALANVYSVHFDVAADALDAAGMLARTMLDQDVLWAAYEHLSGYVRGTVFTAASRLTPDGEGAGTAPPALPESDLGETRVLEHIGFLWFVQRDGTAERSVVIPSDLRKALLAVCARDLRKRSSHAHFLLGFHSKPGRRYSAAPQSGGGALRATRTLVMNALGGAALDETDPLQQLCVVLGVTSTEGQGQGPNGHRVLDADSDQTFAREMLRLWLDLQLDPYSAQLAEGFGVGEDTMVAIVDEHRTQDASDSESGVLPLWQTCWWTLRAEMIVMLSTLKRSRWYRISDLASWLYSCAQYRATDNLGVRWLLEVGSVRGGMLEFMLLPDQHRDRLELQLVDVLEAVFVPLGSLSFSPGREHFRVDPECLYALQHTDDSLGSALHASGGVAEFGISWRPRPSSWPSHRKGVAMFRWIGETTLVVPDNAHFYDLATLVSWAPAQAVGSSYQFHFDRESMGVIDDDPVDVERFLLWLRVRTGAPLPDAVRSSFPIYSSVGDLDAVFVEQAAAAEVGELYDLVSLWGDATPITLAEEIRAWGMPAADFLAARVVEWAESVEKKGASAGDAGPVREALVILGDLRVRPSLEYRNALETLMRRSEDLSICGLAGLAVSRIGYLPAATRLMADGSASDDQRMLGCAVTSALAIMHPEKHEEAVRLMVEFVHDEGISPEMATVATAHLAECAFEDAEGVAATLAEVGRWSESSVPITELGWIDENAPLIWGHPDLNEPLGLIFYSVPDAVRALDETTSRNGSTPSDEQLAIWLGNRLARKW